MYYFLLNFLSWFVFSEREAKVNTFGYVVARLLSPSLFFFLSIKIQLVAAIVLNGFLLISVVVDSVFLFVSKDNANLDDFTKSCDSFMSHVLKVQCLLMFIVLLNTVDRQIVTCPDEINRFSKSTFFHEELLSKEELVSYWKENKGTLDVAQEISQEFLNEQHDLRVFFLKNPQVCIIAVPEPYMGAFEATREITRLLWSVPQAWYHERMHSCKIGLSFSHGDKDKLNILSSKRAIKGQDSARWIAAEDLKKAFPQIDILLITCRGEKSPSYEGDFILDHQTAIWWSTEKGESTPSKWLWHAHENGNLQRFVDMYSY